MRALSFAVMLAVYSMVGAVAAHQLEANECRGKARDALKFAEHRDEGMSLSMAQRSLESGVAMAFQVIDSYIRDEEDKKMVFDMLNDVWSHHETQPGAVYDVTYGQCIGRPSIQSQERNIPVLPADKIGS